MQAITQGTRPSLRTLPVELLLDIISYLRPDAFFAFAFAHYHLLLMHKLAPLLSSRTLRRLRIRATTPTLYQASFFLPAEVFMQILRCLDPVDLLNYVMANYLQLRNRGIAPRLDEEILTRLERAVRSPAD